MFLALRELKQSKVKYGLIGLMMVLLSFLVLMISGLANGLAYNTVSSIQNMDAQKFVLANDAENSLLRSQIKKEDVDDVVKQVGAKDAVPFHVKASTYEKKDSSKKVDIAIFASERETFLEPKIVKGDALGTAQNEMIADESIKEKGIDIGDTIIDPVSKKEFKITGFTKGQKFSHTPVVYVNRNIWGEISQPNQKDYNAIALRTDKEVKNVHIIEKNEVLQTIPGHKGQQNSLTMIIVFLLVIATLLIGVFFYVITLQKTQQLGVLKAIGTKNLYLANTLVVQALFLSVVALAISIMLVEGLQRILPESMPFLLTTTMIGQYAGIFIVISILGTLISLYQVLKVDALEAIGGGM
ncbi:ABC transporter permease [Bacillus thuringiensis serovar pingluonsis]|uniref:Putative hemin transport system permease protein HrtB n=1 Tax=Bacillus thuringiensis serovar pingluonsis TaxID=180881 RepID=A0A243BB29_BACTU|nr:MULTISPECIES: ABC transporter permease [Bacillus cereus group]MEB9683006.1 ABC transporter permease [Bacillus anthracis]OTY41966.1 ABC transporter permease [Bacillus thuringiensis serovar pingluonsis]